MQPIIKNDRIQFERVPRQVVRSRPALACEEGRSASLLRVDGEVRAIQFRCGCGEISVLELEYDSAPDAREVPPTGLEPDSRRQDP